MADASRRPKFELPKGYDSEDEFLREMREEFSADENADFDNHEAGVEDLQFLVGDQWQADVKAEREARRKPVLTINRLPAFIGQVLGERLENETEIKIIPDNGGTKNIAKVREGIVRSIQKTTKADLAYETAFLGTIGAGIGNWKVLLEYVNDDVWEQKIEIAAIPNPFAVVWDRDMIDPTGRDAKRVFEVESKPWKEFKKLWPWATPADMMITRFAAERSTSSAWFTHDNVRIVAYWRMCYETRVLALMTDNTTRDITDERDPMAVSGIAQREDGSPFIREVEKPYAERYLCTATDILEGPYKLPISRVPIFRVPGWELRIGDVKHRWGVLRYLKDPQRLHNYWRSAIAEKIMRSPRATWLAADLAVAGREQQWRDSASTDDPLLIWNSESGQVPQRNDPIQVEGALIEQSAVTTQDLKDVSNIHEANLGMPSNEVSGKAIIQRKTVSRTGTAIYMKRLENAIEETGNVINELIPIVYDTPRIVRILGEDAEPLMQAINQVADGEFLDITQGHYSVSAVTGPSYKTKRQEAAEAMIGLATAIPNTLGVAADIMVGAMDWPDADKIAARLKRSMPPTVFAPDELDEDMKVKLAAAGQAASASASADLQEKGAKILKTQADASLSYARTQKYLADAEAVPISTRTNQFNVASQVASRELNDSLKAIEIGTTAG